MDKSYQLLLFSSQAEYSEGNRTFIWTIDFTEILGDDYKPNTKFNLSLSNITYSPFLNQYEQAWYPFYITSDCMLFRHGRIENNQFTVKSGVEILGLATILTSPIALTPTLTTFFDTEQVFYNAFVSTFTMCRQIGYLRIEYENPAAPFFTPSVDDIFPQSICFQFVFERLNDRRNSQTGWTVNTIPRTLQTSYRFTLSSTQGFTPESAGNRLVAWTNIDFSNIILNPELNAKYNLITRCITFFPFNNDPDFIDMYEIRFYGIPFGFKCYRPGKGYRPYQIIGIYDMRGDSNQSYSMVLRKQFINTFTLRSLKAPIYATLININETQIDFWQGGKAANFTIYFEIQKI